MTRYDEITLFIQENAVSFQTTREAAEEFLTRMVTGSPEEIAAIFARNLQFDVPGHVGALPWIGSRRGREAMSDFIRDLRTHMEPVRFQVDEILTSETRAVILGEMASRAMATGKIVEQYFAIILTLADGEIAGFRMLEDSYAVSRAALH